MPNPSGPDRDDTLGEQPTDPDQQITDSYPVAPTDAEPTTEAIDTGAGAPTEMFVTGSEAESPRQTPPERRFTAPGFDAGATEVIRTVPGPGTEAFQPQSPRKATPQLIPPRLARKLPSTTARGWGWVLALILVILALAAIAVLGTVWLTRGNTPKASQEDQVRATIHDFDTAVQKGDLAALRSITCGAARDGYVGYNDQAWTDTYNRVAAAKQYPVIASVDQVVVNDNHAEANVTAFMAYAPQVRSTRSLDLQYRDDKWKICQSPTG